MRPIQELFPGIQVLDKDSVEVQNPFTGQIAVLDPEEVAVYDLIKGSELFGDYDTVRKGLSWFMNKNAEAYMTLLD